LGRASWQHRQCGSERHLRALRSRPRKSTKELLGWGVGEELGGDGTKCVGVGPPFEWWCVLQQRFEDRCCGGRIWSDLMERPENLKDGVVGMAARIDRGCCQSSNGGSPDFPQDD